MPPPLLISVPSVELNRVKPDGSIFDARRLLTGPFSHSLLQAVQLALDQFGQDGHEILCVARPEMFTHGESLQWLRDRTHGATTHLCISNGQTLKIIPELRNEMFVYGLHRESGLRQYRAMLRRAPELLAGFARQYNSAHETEVARGDHAPEARLLAPMRPYAAGGIYWYYAFYLNRHSHADSAERMLKWGNTTLPHLTSYERAVVIDCSEAAMLDASFCHGLADLITRAAHDPSICLLLLLPDPEDPKGDVTERMRRMLEGVQRGRISVPRVRMDNVFACTGLDEAEFLMLERPFELVLHESFPFWTYTQAFYSAASAIHVHQARRSLNADDRMSLIQHSLLGRQPVMHAWTAQFIQRFGLELH